MADWTSNPEARWKKEIQETLTRIEWLLVDIVKRTKAQQDGLDPVVRGGGDRGLDGPERVGIVDQLAKTVKALKCQHHSLEETAIGLRERIDHLDDKLTTIWSAIDDLQLAVQANERDM